MGEYVEELKKVMTPLISEELHIWGAKILFCIFVILVTRILTMLIRKFIERHLPVLPLHPHKNQNNTGAVGSDIVTQIELEKIIKNIVSIGLWIIAITLIVRMLGYNISAILAGLGIGGAAIALASKETLENFFGSISVYLDKPFHINDRIRILNQADTPFDGFVIDMGLRVSRIKTLDNRIITIPNSFFTKYPIQNVSSEPTTKITQTINIRRDTGYEKIKEAIAILNTLQPDEGALGDPSIASLSTVGFGLYKITFIYFIAKGADYFGTINAVNLQIVRKFEEAGIFTHS
jgi:MscS family membrane protein